MTIRDDHRLRLHARLREARGALARAVRQRQRQAAWRRFPVILGAFGVLFVSLKGVLALAGIDWRPSPPLLLGAGLCALLEALRGAGLLSPPRLGLAEVAARWDADGDPHGLLEAALEFAGSPSHPFRDATLALGVQAAAERPLPGGPPPREDPPVLAAVALLVAILALGLLGGRWADRSGEEPLSPGAARERAHAALPPGKPGIEAPPPRRSDGQEPVPPGTAPPGEARPGRGIPEAPPEVPEVEARAGALGSGAMPAETRTGAGASGRGESASGLSRDSGRPELEARRRPRHPASAPLAPTQRQPPRPGEESGATTGHASGGGGAMKPISSPWSQRDPSEDLPLPENPSDDAIDEERSEQEAHAGTQPALKDRRGTTSRDLAISGPGEGGEGRGGPTPAKKARGAGSLILGVPLPDFVRGILNPGTTKVTYERIPPVPVPSCPQPRSGARGRREPELPVAPGRVPAELRSVIREILPVLHEAGAREESR